MEHVILFHQFDMGGVGKILRELKKYVYIYNLDAQMNILTPNLYQTQRAPWV